MKKQTITAAIAMTVILGSFALSFWPMTPPDSAHALQLASIPWGEFVKESELVVKVTLIKWEVEDHRDVYTFQVSETFKGPKDVKSVVLKTGGRMDAMGPVTIRGEGILWLKKNEEDWVGAVIGRYWWPYTWERNPDHSSTIRVALPNSLLREIPADLKRTPLTLLTLLATGHWHEYQAEIYIKKDVEAFLKAHVK